ncbi:hypothetical protein H9L21_15020 [Aeromicrobium senzhongii]|uniref:SGNH domain-containing protein n=1 Tax=Aeromicrobium senzhongii TaxID=2663859 RepID=A0ABX6SSI0_9ACTN|nr:SGNH hydrolase domain-containing protein [Aeromicrobium senzhongii]MTB89501.1 hypothetical protein [Aeromicrobium senzhongii]QNL94366.1 hypothetical protein H9L21_15020 [Aeromicrobium senzhongii]
MPAARLVRRATGVALVVLLGSAVPAVADQPRLSSIVAAEKDVARGTKACFNGSRPGQTKVLTCHYGRKGPRLLVIGDSHMRALSPAFRRLADQGKIRVTLIIRSRCGWSSRVVKNDAKWIRDDCQTWRRNVERYIRKQRNVRAIVTHHRASTMAGTYAQRGPDTVRSWRVALKRRIPVIALAGAANWKSAGPSPTQCLRKNRAPRQWRNCAAPEREVITFDWSVPSVKLARRQYGSRAAFRINLRAAHCPKRVCRVVTPKGQIMYRDHQHLTATYARSLAPLIERRLRATGVVFRAS